MHRRLLILAAAGATCAAAADLRFHPAEGGAFHFDTGVLKGALRSQGRSTGLLPVTHSPTGTVMARSMGLFGVYRVFSDGRRYGDGMWYFPSQATLTAGGAVSVRWPPAEKYPFEMQALYRWSGPATLDLELSVRPERDLRGFEAFLAAYLGEQFTHSEALVKGGELAAADPEGGAWQMFPRDAGAVALIRDGRWKFPPSPVEWAIRHEFEAPALVRRDPASGLAAVILAPARDCFALSTPRQGDKHYSLYLSLFGRDIRKGETARARARLVIVQSPDAAQVGKLHREFMGGK